MSKRGNAKSAPVQTEQNQSDEITNKQLDMLWSKIQNSPIKEKDLILKSLNETTLKVLRTRNNPYKKPVISGNTTRLIAFNFINLSEKYMKNYTMTSLIGFIYRMNEEYEPKGSENYISENDSKFANPYNKKVKELIVTKPRDLLKQQIMDTNARIENLKGKTDETSLKDLKTLSKTSYVLRAKFMKYEMALLKSSNDELKNKHVATAKSRDSVLESIRVNDIEIEKCVARVSYKENFDKTEFEKKSQAKKSTTEKSTEKSATGVESKELIIDIEPKVRPGMTSVPNLDKQDGNEEFRKRNLDSFIGELNNKKKLSEKYSEQVKELVKECKELEIALSEKASKLEEYQRAFKTLKDDYQKRIKTKQTTLLDNVEVDRYEPSEEDMNNLADEVKKELNILETAEEYADKHKQIIQDFLDTYLRYDPNEHVRSAYRPDSSDPERTELKNETVPERSIIPPEDTFYRWTRYDENNFEALRQATDDIYRERSDLEASIVPLGYFEGATIEEAQEKFDEFKRKYADEFETDVICAKFAVHNLMGPFKENRDRIDFYQKNTEIIKRMLDKQSEDAKIGKLLTTDRAKKKKDAEERKNPGGTKGSEYLRKLNPSLELEKHGAKHISELDKQDKKDQNDKKERETVTINDLPRDNNELTKDEVEIRVHSIKPKIGKGGRRIRGFAEQWNLHVPAEQTREDSAIVETPGEFQKKLLKKKV